MLSPNPVVRLEPSSLYISTTQIFARYGAFHWIIYVTDANGKATTYQWSEQGGTPGLQAEGVDIQELHPVTTYSSTNNLTLAFFKITGFNPATPSDEIRQAALAAFPDRGYPSDMGSQGSAHSHGWGSLVRTDIPEIIEDIVKKRSLEVEENLESFTESVVVDI
ncbi:hypothetical protein F5876DRAFT_74587 [Lentinula aff. lateritia]|uniref:Uncharacterized protein n=1 Tax=Lentinula aff. lateritia TaxID=2804960 RepID=A0ACC1U6J9_9AGAR|nr:hypothetical protein F5876DRAFT_74587 [Lentinula aff. lateritia]